MAVSWERVLEGVLGDIKRQIEDGIREVVDQALADYQDSKDFEEDACGYCRDLGWKEPE